MRLKATFHEDGNFSAEFETVVERETKEIYRGPYEITPSLYAATLATKYKVMINDVIVNAIPYQEVGNLSGGKTVTIGG